MSFTYCIFIIFTYRNLQWVQRLSVSSHTGEFINSEVYCRFELYTEKYNWYVVTLIVVLTTVTL